MAVLIYIQCLWSFHSVQVEALWTSAMVIPCLSPGNLAERLALSKYPPFTVAQSAADMVNIGAVTCSKSLKGNTQPCVMNPSNQCICKKVYPPELSHEEHISSPWMNPPFRPLLHQRLAWSMTMPWHSDCLVELNAVTELDHLDTPPISSLTLRWQSVTCLSRGNMQPRSFDCWRQ